MNKKEGPLRVALAALVVFASINCARPQERSVDEPPPITTPSIGLEPPPQSQSAIEKPPDRGWARHTTNLFRIDIPSDWSGQVTSGDRIAGGGFVVYEESRPIAQLKISIDGGGGVISPQLSNVDDYIEQQRQIFSSRGVTSGMITERWLKVDGKKATELSFLIPEIKGSYPQGYYYMLTTIGENRLIGLITFEGDGAYQQEMISVFNQILSSIRFTN